LRCRLLGISIAVLQCLCGWRCGNRTGMFYSVTPGA
jgi:hypothetical protein